MDAHDDLLQIGEFARRAGTNLRTLRYYEELGLLQPATRSQGGFRFYHRSQLDRMAAIKRLQDLGLPLKEIASAFAVGDVPTAERKRRLRGIVEMQIGLMEARIADLERDLAEARAARSKLADLCQGCDVEMSTEQCDPCPRDGLALSAVLKALL